MKKILIVFLIILSVIFGYFVGGENFFKEGRKQTKVSDNSSKLPLLRVMLLADSHNENDLLGDALGQAGGKGINFVIGLGDYTNLGTVEELSAAKREFDKSKLPYFLTAGDRDGWESRGRAGGDNFEEVFGKSTQVIERDGVRFVLLDNSDIYSGISQEDWEILRKVTEVTDEPKEPKDPKTSGSSGSFGSSGISKLTFVFAHKTPFHPQSSHVMGENSPLVAKQAERMLAIMEGTNEPNEPKGPKVDGFFSGDLHFFAKYNSPSGSVKMTTIGAVASQRNFQGPRFGVLTVWDDWSWEVEDVEIR